MNRFFNMLDFNFNNCVNAENFVQWGRLISTLKKRSFSPGEADLLRNVFTTVFTFSDVSSHTQLAEVFTNKMDSEGTAGLVLDMVKVFFMWAFELPAPVNEEDNSDNSTFSQDDYVFFLRPLGVSEQKAKEAFSILFEGKVDRKPTISELTLLIVQYMSPNAKDQLEVPHQHVFGAWDGDPNITPFQIQKYRKAFQIHDVTVDGSVNVDDYINWGKKAAQAVNPPVEWTKELEQSWAETFSALHGSEDASYTFDTWISGIKQMGLSLDISSSFKKIFATIDTSKDGSCQMSEFRAFLGAVGISEPKADAAFKLMTDGADDMSEEQFVNAYTHFWFDQEPSDYMHFYGVVNAWNDLRQASVADVQKEEAVIPPMSQSKGLIESAAPDPREGASAGGDKPEGTEDFSYGGIALDEN